MAIVLHSSFHGKISQQEAIVETNADPAEYREFIFRCALAICGEPDGAEDVAQEVLLTLFRSAGKIANLENPLAWILRVTVRCATRYLKRQRSSRQPHGAMLSTEFTSDALAVYDILRQLTPEQRALLGMALKQGLTYREIGEALGIPEGTVASRLNAAKKAFQRKWEQ
jgi:RNA polymerase sigma-70 factor (ECF subfamily)